MKETSVTVVTPQTSRKVVMIAGTAISERDEGEEGAEDEGEDDQRAQPADDGLGEDAPAATASRSHY